MELLRQHGLYGGGLVLVDSPLLVSHYNQCLVGIGEKPTELGRFSIDGKGWSPEVAAEKENPDYLSGGGAKQCAIILSPDQMGKPVYHSYFSFERALLIYLFKRSGEAMARITRSTGLWLQMDPGFSEVQSLTDLITINSVNVKLEDPQGLVKAAVNQKKLVARFQNEPDAWADDALRSELVASGERFGNLRFGNGFADTCAYTDTACFYTPEFGGTFVFRNQPGTKPLVVTEKSKDAVKSAAYVASFLKGRNLLQWLINMGLVVIPVEGYPWDSNTLANLRENMLVNAVYQKNGNSDVDFLKLNDAQRQRCAIECRKQLPPEFSLLERLEQQLGRDKCPDWQSLPSSLRWLLARPKEGLPVYIQETVWKLICRVAPVHVTTQLAFDKERFFQAFGTWPEAQQRWAVETILRSGIFPRSHV